jgi:hypothetical protein
MLKIASNKLKTTKLNSLKSIQEMHTVKVAGVVSRLVEFAQSLVCAFRLMSITINKMTNK